MFDERGSDTTIKDLAGRAHPGAEHGTVRGFLMIGVVRFVCNRLGRGDPTDPDDTENQQQGDRVLEATHHEDIGFTL